MIPPKPKGRLLLLSQLFYPEMISSGRNFTELAVALQQAGWEIKVFCAQPAALLGETNASLPALLEYNGIQIRRCRPFGRHRGNLVGRLIFGLSFMIAAAWVAVREAGNVDGIVIGTNPPFLGLAGLLVRWLRRKAYVMVVHDVYPDAAVGAGLLKPGALPAHFWAWVSALIFGKAAANITIGRDMERIIAQKCGRKGCTNIPVIPNWSDERLVYPVPAGRNTFRKLHNPNGHFTVQYSGTMARIHNVEPLLDAAEVLKDEPVLFQFVGDGFKKSKLQQEAQHRGLTNIQFLPFQPEQILAQVLSAADLAVVCLACEFTGLSVPSKAYGILAAGVPILALMEADSEIGLTVKQSDCGIVIPNATGEQVASAIRSLAADPERARVMGRNGHLVFKSRFTLEIAAVNYDKVFREAFLGAANPRIALRPRLVGA